MIVGVGSDLCNIERIQASLDRFGERFEQRVFTDHEIAKAARRPFTKAGTLAKRFAAKEAFSKAVGTGFRRGVFMRDIGVVNLPSGAPTLTLAGGAQAALDALLPKGHVARIHLSLTDDHPWAQAFVIIEAVPASAGTSPIVTDPAPVAQDHAVPADAPPADRAAAVKKSAWKEELKSIVWLVLAVLGFHSFIAKPFYIPSESMLPGLMIGDRLVVTKYPYGWSWVSPTIPSPVALFKGLVLHEPVDSYGIQLPFTKGRLFGRLPERGDVVIVTPPGTNTDYIKRVIGLPGETIAVRDGTVYLNGVPVKRAPERDGYLPVDANTQCSPVDYPGALVRRPDGTAACRLPLVRETLPNGRSYDTVELGWSPGDDYGPIRIPADRVFLMGDNRDRSADSRFPAGEAKGLGGPVPWENLGGRAEFITFSLDGSATLNPLTWWRSLRAGRAGESLHPAEAPAK